MANKLFIEEMSVEYNEQHPVNRGLAEASEYRMADNS